MALLQQSSFVVFLLTITFFFIASPVFCKPNTETLIDRICHYKHVEDYEFCQNIFHIWITSPATDIYGLAKITIQHTLGRAGFIYSNILNLLENTTNRSTKKHLQKCREAYNVVILQFDLAAKLFKKREYEDAFDAERETVLAVEQCKVDIRIPHHPKSPVINANKQTRTLIAMSLASLKLLQSTNDISPSIAPNSLSK